MDKVNEAAVASSLDFTADVLVMGPRTADDLKTKTEDMRARIAMAATASSFYAALGDYFVALDSLAKGNQNEPTSEAASKLVAALGSSPYNVKLSEEKQKALSGLAAYVSTQLHGAAVAKALSRDADTVARALALADAILDEQSAWILLRVRALDAQTYKREVETPFLDLSKTLPPSWKAAWIKQAQGPAIVVVIKDARKASSDMQVVWKATLAGSYSLDEIATSLKEVNDGLDALAKLRSAKTKEESK